MADHDTNPLQSYIAHTQQTVDRLNRALGDLGVTLKGHPVFSFYSVLYNALVDEDMDPREYVLLTSNATTLTEYADLATAFERLAERLQDRDLLDRGPVPASNQSALPGLA